MMRGSDSLLTDEQRKKLKLELLQQKNKLSEQTDEDMNFEEKNTRESTGELSLYDNHPADMGTELFEREKDLALSVHAKAQLAKIDQALLKIDEGKYGVCETCGRPIDVERLKAIPYTTTCVQHAVEEKLPEDRPIEEEILQSAHDNTFANRDLSEAHDDRDSFQAVAQFGTSETPSDLEGDYDHYSDLYSDDEKEGFTEQYESFIATNLEGNTIELNSSENKKQYIDKLDEEEIISPIGNIPYKESDGYVDNEKT